MAAAVAVLTDRDLDRSVLPAVAGVERPRNPGHGDYASNLALQVAGKAGLPPRVMAQAIAEKLTGDPAIQSVEIAGPGFLNIRLAPAAAGTVAGAVVEQAMPMGTGPCWPDSGSTSSSSRPTRPGRSTSAARGGRPLVTRWPGCCARRAPRSAPSTTSTTRARRSTGSPTRCSPPRGARRLRRAATPASTSARSPRRCWPGTRTCPAGRTQPPARSSGPRASR